MFFPGYGFPMPVGRFEQDYHVYPVSFLDKTHLENGDKVIMPPSALDRLASLHIDYPMLFEVQGTTTSKKTHCGVLEFVADEGCVYMPYWMMQNLVVQEGDLVRMTNATLQKGTYVKLQPHTKDFLDISNPKAVLETTLRNFSCLTVGDSIMVAYNNKKYYIDIVECRPDNAISIIETDCEVDFAPPLDYVEPPRPSAAPSAAAAGSSGASGSHSSPAGVKFGGPRPQFRGAAASKKPVEPPKEEEPPEPKFTAFTGSGRRLDGKGGGNPTPVSAGSTAQAQTSSSAPTANGSASSSGRGVGRPAGKVVFGGGSTGGARGPAASAQANSGVEKKEKAEEGSKEEESKFRAFSGKGYSLK